MYVSIVTLQKLFQIYVNVFVQVWLFGFRLATLTFLYHFVYYFDAFLGKKFAQYLPMVMEPVMRMAAMKPEVALLDNDDLETIEGDLDWHFVTLGEQQNFGIKTAGELYNEHINRI